MADAFEYNAPTAPLVRQEFSFEDLVKSMTAMKSVAGTPFVGGIYGEAGTGKTTRAMELMQALVPQDKIILYVYTGVNWTSLMNRPELMNRTRKMQYQSYDQLESLSKLLANKDAVKQLAIGGVVFDEYNTMYDIDLDRISAYRAAEVNASGKVKNGVPVYKDPDTPEWPEYNTAKARLVNMMNNVLQAEDLHYIFVCHPRTGNKSKKIEPDFPDKSAQAFLRALNSLYYLENTVPIGSDQIQRRIVLQGAGLITAKNRIGGLPDFVEDTSQIVEAYRKWGVTPPGEILDQGEKEPPKEVPTVETVKQDIIDAETVEEKVPEQEADAGKSEPFSDPFAGLLGK